MVIGFSRGWFRRLYYLALTIAIPCWPDYRIRHWHLYNESFTLQSSLTAAICMLWCDFARIYLVLFCFGVAGLHFMWFGGRTHLLDGPTNWMDPSCGWILQMDGSTMWMDPPTGWNHQLDGPINCMDQPTGWSQKLDGPTNWIDPICGWTNQLSERTNWMDSPAVGTHQLEGPTNWSVIQCTILPSVDNINEWTVYQTARYFIDA